MYVGSPVSERWSYTLICVCSLWYPSNTFTLNIYCYCVVCVYLNTLQKISCSKWNGFYLILYQAWAHKTILTPPLFYLNVCTTCIKGIDVALSLSKFSGFWNWSACQALVHDSVPTMKNLVNWCRNHAFLQWLKLNVNFVPFFIQNLGQQ